MVSRYGTAICRMMAGRCWSEYTQRCSRHTTHVLYYIAHSNYITYLSAYLQIQLDIDRQTTDWVPWERENKCRHWHTLSLSIGRWNACWQAFRNNRSECIIIGVGICHINITKWNRLQTGISCDNDYNAWMTAESLNKFKKRRNGRGSYKE